MDGIMTINHIKMNKYSNLSIKENSMIFAMVNVGQSVCCSWPKLKYNMVITIITTYFKVVKSKAKCAHLLVFSGDFRKGK
nr:hypothetical protein [Paenibacillus psychroresistens]